MDCHSCEFWDKQYEACDRRHTADVSIECLLRMQIWLLADIHDNLPDDPDEGEAWKGGV